MWLTSPRNYSKKAKRNYYSNVSESQVRCIKRTNHHEPPDMAKCRSAVPWQKHFQLTDGAGSRRRGLHRQWRMRKQKWGTQRVLSRSSPMKGAQRNEVNMIGVKECFLLFLLTFYFQRYRKVENSKMNPACHLVLTFINSSSHFVHLFSYSFPTPQPQDYFEANTRHYFKERLFLFCFAFK